MFAGLVDFLICVCIQSGSEAWGCDSPAHALLKESNWLPFVTLTAQHDPLQEKRWTELRYHNKVDEILRVMAHFLKVKDADVSCVERRTCSALIYFCKEGSQVTCVCACMCVCMCVCVCVCVYIYTSVWCACVYACVCVSVYVHVYICVCM